MRLGLDGRVAVVGGASAGLGYAVAETLAAEGARVLIVSRSKARIDQAVARLRERSGDGVAGLDADLIDPAAPELVVATARRLFGPPTILVANGGGPPAMPAVEASADDLEAACRLLLLPVQRLVRAVLPGMREAGWGRIVAITSIAVLEPQPGLVLSNSLRAAVTGYLKSVADEVAREGITVNSVCPGFTATERLDDLARTMAQRQGVSPAAVVSGWAERAPVARLLRPEEVAAAVAFLCSAPASGITGSALPVDGGLHRGLL